LSSKLVVEQILINVYRGTLII